MVTLRHMLPRKALFWLIFAAYYLSGPIGDWAIYRRLWRIPWSGFAALVRKLVSNELIFGYLGEAQFYAWARTRGNISGTPFGAIKDVALLSALVGNVATVALLAITWPLVMSDAAGIGLRDAFLSMGIVLLSSLAIFFFRQKLFTLPRRELWYIALIHSARTVWALVLGAALWHLALPRIPLAMWMVMSALRMLVSRLPFIPNKDLVFAGLAVFLVGLEPEIGTLMTMMATLTLATHVLVGGCFALADLARLEARA
jgi:hypothetical protein